MRMFETRDMDPEVSTIASEAFSRSWQFIERDPILAGHDRETLQAQLALQIQRLVAAGLEHDPLRVANRAIRSVREKMREPDRRVVAVLLAGT